MKKQSDKSLSISVIIPAYNAVETIDELMKSLKAQTVQSFETILVDDCSTDDTALKAEKYCKVIKLEKNSGPAIARNRGMSIASGDVLAFIDTDCIPANDWIERISKNFLEHDIDVIMGNTHIDSSTFIGDCISGLGFPAGGSIGFEKMWPVDKQGFTISLSSCNFAIRIDIMRKLKGFDEGFFIYGEDSEFAYRLIQSGYKIKYCPEIIVTHQPMTSLSAFLKNQIRRGQGNYNFKKKIGKIGKFIKLRFWSTKNIIMAHLFEIKLPFILILLVLSFVCQQIGYIKSVKEYRKKPLG